MPKCVAAGIISQVFPLHDTESLTRLQKSWVRAIFKRQPLGKCKNSNGAFSDHKSLLIYSFLWINPKIEICLCWRRLLSCTIQARLVKLLFFWIFIDRISEYFGVKIAMYFAWLGHYTTALIVPAVVGFIFWVSSLCRLVFSLSSRGVSIKVGVADSAKPRAQRRRLSQRCRLISGNLLSEARAHSPVA